ncbi:MAG: hypothetical protein ACOYVD_04640 [Bacillota bacterium]
MEEFRFLNSIKKMLQDQRGMVLVFSLLVLIMVAIWGAATLTLSTNEYKISNSSKKAVQAYYVAEAGLEEAIAKLIENPENFTDFVGSLETGSYSVTKSGSIPGMVSLTSIGITDNYQKTLKGTFEIVSSGMPSLEDAVYSSEGDLEFGSNEKLEGDVYAGGSLTFNSNNTINGDIYTGGEGEFNSNNTIHGNIYVAGGKLVFNSETDIYGNLYVRGDIDFHNNTNIYGDIYLMGTLSHHQHFYISGNIYYHWDGQFPSKYDITLTDLN